MLCKYYTDISYGGNRMNKVIRNLKRERIVLNLMNKNLYLVRNYNQEKLKI